MKLSDALNFTSNHSFTDKQLRALDWLLLRGVHHLKGTNFFKLKDWTKEDTEIIKYLDSQMVNMRTRISKLSFHKWDPPTFKWKNKPNKDEL